MNSPITDWLMNADETGAIQDRPVSSSQVSSTSQNNQQTIGFQFIDQCIFDQVERIPIHSTAPTLGIGEQPTREVQQAAKSFEDLLYRPHELENCTFPATYLKNNSERLGIVHAIKKCERRGYAFIKNDSWWERNRIYWLTLLHYRMHLPRAPRSANRYRLLLTTYAQRAITKFDPDSLTIIWLFKSSKTSRIPLNCVRLFEDHPNLITQLSDILLQVIIPETLIRYKKLLRRNGHTLQQINGNKIFSPNDWETRH